MRIGIGLPAAVPGRPVSEVGEWAAASEREGFESLGVLDRLVYDNLDPIVALDSGCRRRDAEAAVDWAHLTRSVRAAAQPAIVVISNHLAGGAEHRSVLGRELVVAPADRSCPFRLKPAS